ncbi:hypothetical protein OQA88_11869 [Cercophora sp. LCS_1]
MSSPSINIHPIGNRSNSWLFNPASGWDLTHSPEALSPRLTLRTTTAPITINPTRTALIVVDMQNFFLSPVLGRAPGPGHAAYQVLLSTAFPAARRAGIRIIHLTWGITPSDLATLPPVIFRGFGFTHTPAGDGTWLETQNPITIGDDMGTLGTPTIKAGIEQMKD